MRGEDMLSLLKAKEQGMLWELPNKQEYLKLDLQTHIKEKKNIGCMIFRDDMYCKSF